MKTKFHLLFLLLTLITGRSLAQSVGATSIRGGIGCTPPPHNCFVMIAATTTGVSCHGGSDGHINTTASGGFAPYTYSWSNGCHAADPTGLAAGTYTVTVTDVHGCRATAAYTVTQPAAISISGVVINPNCHSSCGSTSITGATGSINTTVTGGTPAYSYSWSNGCHSADPTGLHAGTYHLTVTDHNGCTSSATYSVVEPAPITLTASTSDVSCHGGSNGRISVVASGGTPGYTYSWHHGCHTGGATGLSAGTYHLTVTDAHGCSANATYTITEPEALTVSATTTNVSCHGGHNGSITPTAAGGTAPYTYSWSHGCHTAGSTGLSAGTYNLTVTDAHGCTAHGTYTITEPSAIVISATTANVRCHGGDHGHINTTVTGGTPGYSYLWSNGCHASDPSGLSAGTYHVTVTDANGCTEGASYTITEPHAIHIAGTVTDASCNGDHNGSINTTVTGGTPAYLYTWSNGCHTHDPSGLSAGTYHLTVIDEHLCHATASFTVNEPAVLTLTATTTNVSCHGGHNGEINPVVTGGTAPYTYSWSHSCHTAGTTGLSAGTYNLTVTDAHGCKASGSYTITEPSAISISGTTHNVHCHDGHNGSINTTVSGGTPGYSYSWSNGCHTADPSGLTAGTYHLTVTDANGCKATATYTITEPAAIVLTSHILDVRCHGGLGYINVEAHGGCPWYSYNWSTGGAGFGLYNNFFGPAGTYNVRVTDARGCHTTGSFTIAQPAVLHIAGTATNVSCHGGNNGSVNTTVTGGTAPYHYNWSTGCHTADPSGLSAGTYNLTVTDAHGCSANATYTITEPEALTVSATTTNVSCHGGHNGSITPTAAGGTAPYTYSWSHGCHTAGSTGLSAGTYNLTVTDAHGCTAHGTYTITEPSAIVISATTANVRCHGGDHGHINTTVTGGTPGYSYLWSNGCHASDPSGLSAGTYHVTVTDANGCTEGASYTITEPHAIHIAGTVTDASCNGDHNGSINTTVTGGTPAYLYTWSSGCHTHDPSGLSAGTYHLTVIDEHLCHATASFTVNEPAVLTLTATTTNVSCHGGHNGEINPVVTGGTAPYTYSWSHSCHTAGTTGLSAGTYNLTVTDAHGCKASGSYTITEPSAISISGTTHNVHCHDGHNGSINTTVSGGTPGYSYSWSNGCHTADPSGLTAGTYHLTVTDANGCKATATYTITEPAAIVLTSHILDVRCHGGLGYINVEAHGGCPWYSYNWSTGGAGFGLYNNFFGPAGTYNVRVTDARGCHTTGSFTIAQPAVLHIAGTATNVSCHGGNNGSVNTTVTGGTAPYHYNWSTGCHTADPSGLSAGTYNLTVTDAHGCSANATYTITEPEALTVSATTTNVSCHGGHNGSITPTAAGGTAPYTYSWSHGCHTAGSTGLSAGTYNLTVTDAHGCTVHGTYTITEPSAISITATVTNVRGCHGASNGHINTTVTGGTGGYSYSWSNGCHASDPSGLSAGTYNLTVTDANGCTSTATYTITEPAAINISGTVTNISCHGEHDGRINTTVTGGVCAYAYSWSNGCHTADPSGLSAGTYHLTVTDAHGCTASASFTVAEPAPLRITDSVMNVSCHGGHNGHIYAFACGGTAPYTYSWSHGCHTADPSDLAAGTYHLTVTDAHGCKASASYTITEPAALSLSATTSNVTCHGGNNGHITATTGGGTAPYSYSWGHGCHTANPSALSAGTYHLTVTDANGCSVSGTYTITEPSAISITATTTNVRGCNGAHNGSINTTITGGTPGYSYSWSNGCHAQDPSGLAGGIYSLTVTDANGCTTAATYTITEPAAIHIAATTANVSCHGGNNGHITTTVTGGVCPYTYTWSSGCHTADPSSLTAGTYHLTVTDAHGCSASATYTITEPAALSISATTCNVSCNGGHNGKVHATVTGGTAPYSYSWGHGCHEADPSELSAGTYHLTVTDANGCTVSATYTITEPAPIVLTDHIHNVTCNRGRDGHIEVHAAGGTPGYTYSWMWPGEAGYGIGNDFYGAAGTYTVTVTDAHGCEATGLYTITQPAPIVITGTATNVSCHGGHDGRINTTVSGSACGGYTYDWSNGCHSADPSGLSAGIYWLTVTDAHGCSARTSFAVDQPSPIKIAATTSDVTCHGGSNGHINTTVSGGSCGGYSYSWSNGCHSADPSGLSAGCYHLTVTDAHGCTATGSYTIGQPAAITLTAATANVSCHGGHDGYVHVTATGGTAPYSYSWGHGCHTTDPSELSAGTYTVTVTDAHGCTATATYTITEPSELALGGHVHAVSCHGGRDGHIDVDPSGGTPGYSFEWQNAGEAGYGHGDDFYGTAGTYCVIVTDAHGCKAKGSYTITEPSAIHICATVSNVSCHGGNDGHIITTVTGGTCAYTYSWSHGCHTADPSALSAGTYDLTVTDARGCTAHATYTVTEPSGIHIAGIVTNVTCHGGDNGRINTTVTGGACPYTYSWSTGACHTADPSGLSAGTYHLTVTDVNGCTATATYTVTQPAAIHISACLMDPSCHGCSNGHINTTVSGGTPCYTYSWSNGSHVADPCGLSAGTYCLTVTDADRCTASERYTLTDPHAGPCAKSPTNNGGTIEADATDVIKVYPNPTSGVFSVVIPTVHKDAEIVITDVTGKTIDQKSVTNNIGEAYKFTLSNLTGGMYVVKVYSDNVTYVEKLILE